MNSFERALGLACGKTDHQMMQEEQHQAALKSLQLQALQTGLLAQMSNSLGAIHEEVARARADQAEALALQQQMLAREELQSHLEEFIYQSEKLVAACRNPKTDIPPSTRYYLLDGVVQQVEQDGIATAIIRGRENKAAFERVFAEVQQLRSALKSDPEVKAALAWAAKIDQQRAEQRRQIELKMRPYQQQLDTLRNGRSPVTLRDAWAKWKQKIGGWVPPQYKVPVIVLLVCASPVLIFASPYILLGGFLGLLIDKGKMNKDRNAEIDAQIEEVEKKLRVLQDKLEKV